MPDIQLVRVGSLCNPSGQPHAVINAAVVTLALPRDIDAIAGRTKNLPKDWQTRQPNNASPYTSTIMFLVRKGNPNGFKDWADLAGPPALCFRSASASWPRWQRSVADSRGCHPPLDSGARAARLA
jgi:hypothetical protein